MGNCADRINKIYNILRYNYCVNKNKVSKYSQLYAHLFNNDNNKEIYIMTNFHVNFFLKYGTLKNISASCIHRLLFVIKSAAVTPGNKKTNSKIGIK